GGDWSSFFHKFEAVASQSTANVSHPSIVDDNVPLPIIRGHHFDIAYHDAMDEHVKCQVCGMLLRRTMFAAHVQQRHPELCPPLSTDDDSGRHSGLESPDISRNPSFPFSPKLMSPPIKEPIKLTISMKGHRKHRRRKSKRDRRRESRTASLDEEELSPRGQSPKITGQPHRRDDRFLWPSDGEQPGPSTHRISPIVLREKLAVSPLSKGLGSSGGIEHLRSRVVLSDQVRDSVEHSSDEQSKRKTKKRTRRKSNMWVFVFHFSCWFLI
ncbi:unnamed protein product, partial [Nippostrongylus brasiliensis]|uniref:C2H2-type domain-containing protein n=1 Tax=Nippostrongylus brasiliensis TaxID=27835 RepID=A0A0N4XIN4_NIPBR